MRPTLAELEESLEYMKQLHKTLPHRNDTRNIYFTEGEISIMKEWRVEEMYELLKEIMRNVVSSENAIKHRIKAKQLLTEMEGENNGC